MRSTFLFALAIAVSVTGVSAQASLGKLPNNTRQLRQLRQLPHHRTATAPPTHATPTQSEDKLRAATDKLQQQLVSKVIYKEESIHDEKKLVRDLEVTN